MKARATVRPLALIALMGLAAPAGAVGSRLAVDESRFVLMTPEGVRLPEGHLAGTVVTLGDGTGARRRLRIENILPDPRDPKGLRRLYELTEQDPAAGVWRNICDPDPDGRRLAFPLPGRFSPQGVYEPVAGGVTITCTGGADGKCIRFGYEPWGRLPDGSPMLPYYQACVRAVRADYCGDGVGHTRNGTPIDIFDRVGVQSDENSPGLGFEAAFAPDGAVCVRRTRLPKIFDRADLAAACPRLPLADASSCSDQAAGLVFIRSYGP